MDTVVVSFDDDDDVGDDVDELTSPVRVSCRHGEPRIDYSDIRDDVSRTVA